MTIEINQELWNKILAFDFDNPPSEYGFSIRLANENYWTKDFTNQAILEYKKFMYLATISDYMVSPSEIVDIVWHQHLIFTHSYQDLCNILGKQIQHIPSTHNKEDFDKFKQSKERTLKFYERYFGKQPENIWSYNDMFESMNLEKAKYKLRTLIIIGILAFISLIFPAYYLLRPFFIKIDNPYFLFGFSFLVICVYSILKLYNEIKLKRIVSGFDQLCFIYNLQPFELVYLKTQKLSNVVNGTVNELIDNGTIKVNSNKSIELVKHGVTTNNTQLQVTSTLSELGTTFYPIVLKKLVLKPIFKNTANSMDAFEKYFNKSKKFGSLFFINFVALTIILLLPFTRILIGISREKPVVQIVLLTIVLTILTITFLQKLTKQISTTTIPNLYKNEILPKRDLKDDWQWTYFLLGSAALTTTFVPVANYIDRNGSYRDYGNSCGSSCGSSCSSCGGCGGGD